jgi:flavin-dependent dehydrogenase
VSSKSAEIFDLVIVGAGPAGAAAALRGRALDATVCVVEKCKFPRPRVCGGWIGPSGVALLREMGVEAKPAGGAEFVGLRIYSIDLKKSATVKDKELAGWIVDRAKLDAALAAKAKAAGAELRFGASIESVTLGEDRATLKLADGDMVTGRILLLADGIHSPTARQANLPAAGRSQDMAHFVHADGPAIKGALGMDVVIGAGRIVQIGTIVRATDRTRISLATRTKPDAALQCFDVIAKAAAGLGLAPAELGTPITGVVPLGAALDIDSHVGKRCMLIGDAGGFVATFSGEGVYPALRSGAIAAEVACKAIKSRWVQDELAGFGDAWRSQLADYLRMPNTDLSLLMPLVFSNAQMSTRVAKAFLLGQQF